MNLYISTFLQLNVTKTKDMSFDFRHQPSTKSAIIIEGGVVDSVENHKQILIDNKLNFNFNTEMLCKKETVPHDHILYILYWVCFNLFINLLVCTYQGSEGLRSSVAN